jgi:hypothetical protein
MDNFSGLFRWILPARPTFRRSVPQRNRILKNAIPEPVLRKRSNSAARAFLEKQTAVLKRQGLDDAVDRTMP